jgi:segregation and condensation protein A
VPALVFSRGHAGLACHDGVAAPAPMCRQPWVRRSTLTVRLPVFEGPLELLLYLIERRQLDITAVSLVAIADQYLEHLAELRIRGAVDPGAIADFLAVAARLLQLKSRALLPRSAPNHPSDGADEPDVGAADLVQRLQEYRLFRDAAVELRRLLDADRVCYVRVAAPDAGIIGPAPLEPVPPDSLARALRRVLERLRPPAEELPAMDFRVADKIALLQAELMRSGRLALTRLLVQCSCRLEAVVTFLAVLELLKLGQVCAHQEGLFGEIWLSRPAT